MGYNYNVIIYYQKKCNWNDDLLGDELGKGRIDVWVDNEKHTYLTGLRWAEWKYIEK